MKQARQIITKMLSVYLLVLMVLPCNDAHATTQTFQKTQVSQVESAQHHDDFCTPFCICSCCTTPIIIQNNTFFEVPFFENYFTETTSFYQSIRSDFYASIWQPPQIV